MKIFLNFSILYFLCDLQCSKCAFYSFIIYHFSVRKFLLPLLRFWAVKTIAVSLPRHHGLIPSSTPHLSPSFFKTPFENTVSHFSYSCYTVVYIPPNPFSSEPEGVEIEWDASALGLADNVNFWAKAYM
jgi:hypothetical protein